MEIVRTKTGNSSTFQKKEIVHIKTTINPNDKKSNYFLKSAIRTISFFEKSNHFRITQIDNSPSYHSSVSSINIINELRAKPTKL